VPLLINLSEQSHQLISRNDGERACIYFKRMLAFVKCVILISYLKPLRLCCQITGSVSTYDTHWSVHTITIDVTLLLIACRVGYRPALTCHCYVSYVTWRNGFKYEIYLYIHLLEAVNPAFEVSTLTSTFQRHRMYTILTACQQWYSLSVSVGRKVYNILLFKVSEVSLFD
jgi:hypothetical protein